MPDVKRFAFVVSDLYGGGAEKSLLYTAEGLRQRGNIVKVFILRNRIEQDIPAELEVENIAVITDLTKALNNAQGKRMKTFIPRECPPDTSHPAPLSSVFAGFRP